MDDLQIIKRIINERSERANAKTVKAIAKKHGVKIRKCNCPNALADAALEVYSKLKQDKRHVPRVLFHARFVGGADVVTSNFGIIGKNTSQAKAYTIFRRDYQLFSHFFVLD